MGLNNQWITEENKEEIKKYLETNDNPKPKVLSKNNSKKEAYCNTVLPQETRKITNKQPYITLQATRERINKT
jgi:hypothetical protein